MYPCLAIPFRIINFRRLCFPFYCICQLRGERIVK